MEVLGTLVGNKKIGKITLKGVENYVELITRREVNIGMLESVVEIRIKGSIVVKVRSSSLHI